MTQHRKCWVWLTTQASPQPNDSVLEMLSLALHTGLSTAQEIRVGNAESGSLRVNYQGTVTQSRRCWVWLYVVYVQKWIWLTCWANWFLAACRLVSLWATNQEVPFTIASHCRSWSCWNWPCSYRIPDSRTGGCSKIHRNSCPVKMHQKTANSAFSCLLGLKSQCH